MLLNQVDEHKNKAPDPFVEFRADVERERQAELTRITKMVGMSDDTDIINFKSQIFL